MGAVGKHFPGHGYVRADSHHEVPVDDRDLATIEANDLAPYRALIGAGLAGVMPAHVIYPRVDPKPAGFSRFWLQEILRARLGFDGIVFSDDLSMEGASVAGGIVERGRAALEAGCDMVLVCNARDGGATAARRSRICASRRRQGRAHPGTACGCVRGCAPAIEGRSGKSRGRATMGSSPEPGGR